MINFLYQAYGNERIYSQALFSILTTSYFLNSAKTEHRIIVYTDNRDLFENYNVITEPLPADRVRAWKGPYDFIHRLKIEMIQDCANRYPGNLVYLDTDTYFKMSPHELLNSLDRETSIMFRNEGDLSKTNHPLLYKFVSKKGAPLGISKGKRISMWNAGVIGVHKSNFTLFNRILRLNDEIYREFYRHTVEQFAFSYVLQDKTVLKDAESCVTHYVGPSRTLVEDVIIGFLKQHQGDGDLGRLSELASQLDPASGVTIPEKTLIEKVVDFFVRLSKSVKNRINRAQQKM